MASLSINHRQLKAPLKNKQPTITNIEQPFDFLGLPLEIRDIVYTYLYIKDETQLAQDPSVVSEVVFPYLSYSIHLVCKIITAEIDAFLRRQKLRIPINMCDFVDDYDSPRERSVWLQKRLRCPTAGDVYYVSPPELDPEFHPGSFVAVVLDIVSTIRNAPLSVPNRELHVSFQHEFFFERGYEVYFCIDVEELITFELDILARNVFFQDTLALGDHDDTLNDLDAVLSAYLLLDSRLSELQKGTEPY